jgi:hypothetical protein
MKTDDLFVENRKEVNELAKLKLPLKKSTIETLLSKATTRNTDYYSMIQMWRGKIIERVFAVRLNRKRMPEYQEVMRRIEGNSLAINRNVYFGQMAGYRTVWSDTRPSRWYFDMDNYYNQWYISSMNYFNVYIRYLFTLNDIKKIDQSLQYCAWNGQPVIYFITLYRKYPEIEMLSKLGLNRLMYN